MANYYLREFVELNSLMSKFSFHIEKPLLRALYAEYKKILINCHHSLPQNILLIDKIKSFENIELQIDIVRPGEIKLHLQQEIHEIISEIDLVMKSLND